MATGISNLYSKINTKPKLGRWSSRYMPRVIAVAQNPCYWASIEAEVETYLKNAIPIKSPESVFEPMHHLTFAAPRTTASALCVAACELVGGDRRQALAAASAIHLMHAASYTHQNLPLTDRPRPKPTVEHKYTPNVELLTGDGILPFGFELVARSQANPDRILRVGRGIAHLSLSHFPLFSLSPTPLCLGVQPPLFTPLFIVCYRYQSITLIFLHLYKGTMVPLFWCGWRYSVHNIL
ncbi:hypothetical protein ACS0TY_033525 [Phlomoides rotata]